MGAAQDSHQPDSPAPAQPDREFEYVDTPDGIDRVPVRQQAATTPAPSFTPGPWIRKGESVYTRDGGLIATVYDGHNYAEEIAGERTHDTVTAVSNAHIVAGSPSLYAYAKAVQIRKALSDALIDELTADSRKPSDASNAASEAFQSHLAAMGWDRKQFAGDFLETYRAAALAQAEGRNP